MILLTDISTCCSLSPAVVEESAAPVRMLSSGTCMEEAGVRPIKIVQAVLRVAGGVAVHQVQQDSDAQRVGLIH